MQPLKRFTQCGSLTMLLAVFILLFGVSSTALSTFGKSNPNTIQPQSTPRPTTKAKECTSHADCVILQNTSCVRDFYDDRYRCLCGDNTAPDNGKCDTKIKGLKHICIDITQCDEGLICTVDNSTKTTGLGLKNPSLHAMKFCFCDEEGGYTENLSGSACNGAITIFTGVFVPMLSLVIGSMLAKKPMQY